MSNEANTICCISPYLSTIRSSGRAEWGDVGEFLAEHSHRIHCLETLDHSVFRFQFSNLECLRMPYPREAIPLAAFSKHKFPALRNLEIQLELTSLRQGSFAWIEQLQITVNENFNWEGPVTQLGARLISLTIVVKNFPCDELSTTFELPNLRFLCLDQLYQRSAGLISWDFSASTPSLSSFSTFSPSLADVAQRTEVTVDVSKVTHLEIKWEGQPFHLSTYTKLKYLRLLFHPSNIMQQLANDDNICPLLELIEYRVEEDEPDFEEIQLLSKILPQNAIPTIIRTHSSHSREGQAVRVHCMDRTWSVKLPYEITITVSYFRYESRSTFISNHFSAGHICHG